MIQSFTQFQIQFFFHSGGWIKKNLEPCARRYVDANPKKTCRFQDSWIHVERAKRHINNDLVLTEMTCLIKYENLERGCH